MSIPKGHLPSIGQPSMDTPFMGQPSMNSGHSTIYHESTVITRTCNHKACNELLLVRTAFRPLNKTLDANKIPNRLPTENPTEDPPNRTNGTDNDLISEFTKAAAAYYETRNLPDVPELVSDQQDNDWMSVLDVLSTIEK